MNIYLDNAAATPVEEDVLAAMQPFYRENFYNPSALYQPALAVHSKLEEARSTVAKHLGVRPAEVIFTAGGTEANNLALQGIMRAYQGKSLLYSALEHDSVRNPAHYLKTNGWEAVEIQPNQQGIIEPSSVTEAIDDSTVLVSIMLANNEIGTIQPIKKISGGIEKIRSERKKSGNKTPLYFHTDACQAVNYLDVNMHRLGVDMLTLNGGKIYGPKQSGILAMRSHVNLEPLLYGGGQEFNRRSGTENVAHAIGLACAVEITDSKRSEEVKRLAELQSWFADELIQINQNIRINGSRKNRLPNNVHITIPGADNERLLFALDDRGVCIAAGSACSASKEESSHVLKSIGLSDKDARSSLRITMGRQTDRGQLELVLQHLKDLF